ncbi:hypothetical protein PFISCL1PPCAC_61, partial [Pristionchus fissidentatus]
NLCATMELGRIRRTSDLIDPGIRQHRRDSDIVDASFASACQAVRTNKEQCPFGCNKLLAPRTIDYHRLNGCRGKQEDAFADLSKKRSFTCGACYEEFVTRDAFFQHLSADHAVDATIHSCVFPDVSTFERFRYWLEAQGGAHFRQKSGAKSRPSGKGIFMMCNRSGLVHTSGATGEPDKDKIGSYRTGFTCTAFINGTFFPDGHVSIRYCGDHYGHDARMRLPQSVKNTIMHKQMRGATNTQIIRYLQHHFMPLAYDNIHSQRVALVDQEEMRSITPMLKKLHMIPFEKEEVWEEEFLEAAGIIREWAPRRTRPEGWLPIKKLAERMHWPLPTTFVPKIRNSRGEWMIIDEDRGGYVLEADSQNKAHFLDGEGELELEEDGEFPVPDKHQDHQREEEEEQRIAEEREGEHVDVEGLRESKEELAGTSSSFAKKPRLEESVVVEGGGEREERTENDVLAELEEDERIQREESEERSGSGVRTSFLTSSIVAELDMIKALVKSESEYLSETELSSFLQRARVLRLSFEPVPRSARSSVGQREFVVPQLSRPSRVSSGRGRRTLIRPSELRSPAQYSNWTDGKREAIDIDVCDEEIVVGTSGGGAKMQYNSRFWT